MESTLKYIAILVALLAYAHGSAASDWPAFRGDGTCHANPGNYPLTWSPTENIAWQVKLPGFGQSAPIIHDGQLVLTAVAGEQKETNHVIAIDATSGKEHWTYSFPSCAPTKSTPMISRAAPTPVADQNGIYAFFESGDLIALTNQGDVRWQRSLSDDYGVFINHHGIGSSPTQNDTSLFLVIDQEQSGYVVAIDKETGQTLWKTDRSLGTSWSSPILASFGNTPQVVISSAGSVDGYDARSGKCLWSYTDLVGNSVPSPTIEGDDIFIGARVGRSGENNRHIAESNCCLRIRAQDDHFQISKAWASQNVFSHYASPLVVEDHVFYSNKVGVLYCLDRHSGKVLHRLRTGKPYWATPIATSDFIYLFAEDGTTSIVSNEMPLRIVGRNTLWTESTSNVPPDASTPSTKTDAHAEYDRPTIYGVAAANGAFYARSGTDVFCIRTK